MGEAKRRGTFEQRKADSINRKETKQPEQPEQPEQLTWADKAIQKALRGK